MDFLYQTSQQLVIASTPGEILEAVSLYARAKGAVTANLGYFDDFQPYWLEIVATWAEAEAYLAPIGLRVEVHNRKLTQVGFATPNRPMFVSDILNSEFVDFDTQHLASHYHARALVTLPLYSNGRWIAVISFGWKGVYAFNQQDERVYSTLQQYAASAVATARLFKDSLDRAVELEIAKREIDILYEFSSQLLTSSTSEEVLNAVSGYARDNGASSGHLFYANDTDKGWIELAAEWSLLDHQVVGVGRRLAVPDRSLHDRWISHPEQPTLIADILDSHRPIVDNSPMLQEFAVRAFVALPLNSKGRWLGVIYFLWDSPHAFDSRDERIFTALQSQVSPVVDSIRLLEQSQRRAIELEQTNQELNLLYRASEVINSANSYAEIVEAVAYFDSEADMVMLLLWEGFDWENATYEEVVFVLDRTGDGVLQSGTRLMKEDYPIAEHMVGQRIWLFEDALTDPRMDPVTAKSWAALNTRAFISLALYVGTRWIGGLRFNSARPRRYSEREVRLFAAIADLVAAAVERTRLQQETISANQEIDLLYQVGESINAANTYQELVHALKGIISGLITVGLYFWENWDYETASHVEVAAGTGTMMARIGQQIPRSALAYTETLSRDSMVVIEDVARDPRLDPGTISRYLESGLYAVISIRLYVGERWIGALTFQSGTPRQFSVQERRLVSGVGDYVRGAAERIRLQQETEAARLAAEQLAVQAQQLAALEERNRLARELHDSVSQVLYTISLWGHSARAFLKHDPTRIDEAVGHILSLAEVGLSEMRALIFDLRPESLEEEGLVSILRKQAQSLQSRHGIQITTSFCDEPNLALPVKSDLYRVAREALHNAIKHAQSTQIRLSLLELQAGYSLEISDNGLGFDTSQVFPGHLGLKSMQERAAALKGLIQIESAVGVGTRITLTIPS
ncbi:MAG: GAF domain-containing protein [Anaerolineae bacterium]|nr:GAF domain-containing protein [Anaerolineae bacterium]